MPDLVPMFATEEDIQPLPAELEHALASFVYNAQSRQRWPTFTAILLQYIAENYSGGGPEGKHAATHKAAGSDPLAGISQSQIDGLVDALGKKLESIKVGAGIDGDGVTTALTLALHAATHAKGAADAISPSSIDAADRQHTHQQSDVNGLTDALNSKIGYVTVAQNSPFLGTGTPGDPLAFDRTTFADKVHDHPTSEVEGLDEALASLQAAIDDKPSTIHTQYPITGDGSAENPVTFDGDVSVPAHAQTHATDGDDPVTPDSIGASAIGHRHSATDIDAPDITFACDPENGDDEDADATMTGEALYRTPARAVARISELSKTYRGQYALFLNDGEYDGEITAQAIEGLTISGGPGAVFRGAINALDCPGVSLAGFYIGSDSVQPYAVQSSRSGVFLDGVTIGTCNHGFLRAEDGSEIQVSGSVAVEAGMPVVFSMLQSTFENVGTITVPTGAVFKRFLVVEDNSTAALSGNVAASGCSGVGYSATFGSVVSGNVAELENAFSLPPEIYGN